MRDAIGQVFALQVILAFVLLINGYMAYSVNYTRAFRVKNQIVNIIEQYEGPTDEAMAKIGSYVDGMTYRVPQTLINNFRNRYASNSDDGEVSCQDGWCYIAHDVRTTGGDGEMNGTYYSVVTFVNIDIPVINNLIGLGDFLSVSGETRTIYR